MQAPIMGLPVNGLKKPGEQGTQDALPVSGLYSPTPHGAQPVPPVQKIKVPGGQGKHLSTESLPSEFPYFPAGQPRKSLLELLPRFGL